MPSKRSATMGRFLMLGVSAIAAITFCFIRFPTKFQLSYFKIASEHKVFDEKLRLFMNYQSTARQGVLQQYLQTKSQDFGPFYNALVAEIVCPWLARVGNVNDGGKWTCNPWALADNCVVYSLGVGPDISFEIEMDQVTDQRCKIYSFDPAPYLGQRLVDMKSDRFTFLPFRIAETTNAAAHQFSMKDIMSKLNHSFIDFFKIDIENSEFSILPSMLTNKNKPVACQLFIEMHGTPGDCAVLHNLLAKAGFYMFFYEINGFHHTLSEYSFMHDSCFDQYHITNVLSRNFP